MAATRPRPYYESGSDDEGSSISSSGYFDPKASSPPINFRVSPSIMAIPNEPATIFLARDADLKIRVHLPAKGNNSSSNRKERTMPKGIIISIFMVRKDLVKTNCPGFRDLQPFETVEGGLQVLDIEAESAVGFEVCFRVLHKALAPSLWNVSWKDFMSIFSATNIFFTGGPIGLKSWFATWVSKNQAEISLGYVNIVELSTLMFASQVFDHPELFMATTKRHVYGSPSITAFGSSSGSFLESALNEAQYSLMKMMVGCIYDMRKKFIDCGCSYSGTALIAFEKALKPTRIGRADRNCSVHSMIRQLQYEFYYQLPLLSTGEVECCTCGTSITTFQDWCAGCSEDLNSTFRDKTVYAVKNQFEGLCVDCLKNATFKITVPEYDAQGNRVWDSNCRVSHGATTWWFSWLAGGPRKLDFAMKSALLAELMWHDNIFTRDAGKEAARIRREIQLANAKSEYHAANQKAAQALAAAQLARETLDGLIARG